MTGIDLRIADPRSPHEYLAGMKLLARVVDKGWATILGTNGLYVFFDCSLDRVLFESLNVTRDDFITVVKNAYRSNAVANTVALFDLRESLENEPEISDETFLQHATASDIDDAVVRWVHDSLQIPPTIISMINAYVDRLPEEGFDDRKK